MNSTVGKILFWLLATFLLTTAPPALAQQPAKMPKIGTLSSGPLSRPWRASFQREFQKLGYVEGRNVISSIDPLILITTDFQPWLKSWSVSR